MANRNGSETGNRQPATEREKMLRSQILEHLQTRQSSENLQIDCIPVPRSRCGCSQPTANIQHPASSRDMKSSRVQILHISARNFGNFPELLLSIEPSRPLPGCKYASHQKCKHIKFMSLSIILFKSGSPIKRSSSRQCEAA